MELIRRLLNRFNGLHYAKEYLCFGKEIFPEPPHFYLVANGLVISDLTSQHLFVGYSPLIFAFNASALPTAPATLQLILSQHLFAPNAFFAKKDALAMLSLRLVKKLETDDTVILFYEGTDGRHHFLSAFQRWVNARINSWFNKKPGNVFLENNLYRQVQIAYALPRTISLITVGDDQGLYNLFPTDLHGQADGEHYIISLRTGGLACQQVMAAGKLLLSDMEPVACSMVYSLGKNHMKPLRPAADFPFSDYVSASFAWPLPQQAVAAKELRLLQSFEQGIHTLLLFRILNQQEFSAAAGTLAHIHNCYASWRYKKGLAGNYLSF